MTNIEDIIMELDSGGTPDCSVLEVIECLEQARDTISDLEDEIADSKREAKSLAMSLWYKHYQDVSPDFELCDSTAGVIAQINNMSAGLAEKVEELKTDLHYCNGVSDLAMKHRDFAEAKVEENRDDCIQEIRDTFESDAIDSWKKANAELQAKVEKLETTVKDLVGVAQDSSYGRHYLRTHYPELKQEGE